MSGFPPPPNQGFPPPPGPGQFRPPPGAPKGLLNTHQGFLPPPGNTMNQAPPAAGSFTSPPAPAANQLNAGMQGMSLQGRSAPPPPGLPAAPQQGML